MDARGRKRPAHGTLCGPKPSAYPSDPLQSGITWYRSDGACRTARQAQNSSVQCRRGVSLWWDQRRTLVGRGIYTRMRDASRTGSRRRSSRSSRCLSDRCPRGAGRSGVCPYDAAPAHLSEHAGQLEVEAAAVAGLVAANLSPSSLLPSQRATARRCMRRAYDGRLRGECVSVQTESLSG